MSKPTCVRSHAVKVCQDELMTELLRHFDPDELASVLHEAHDAARIRMIKSRHNRYKAQIFFRHMAERLPDIPDLLGLALKITDPEHLDVPSVGVELSHTDHCRAVTHIGGSCNCGAETAQALTDIRKKGFHGGVLVPPERVEAVAANLKEIANLASEAPTSGVVETVEPVEPASERMREALKGKNPPTDPPPESFDEFAGMLNVPKFEDFDAVFASWPYVMESTLDDDRVLILGYLSGRDTRNDDVLVRRNCAYTFRDTEDKPFKGLVSMVGYLKKTVRGNRLHIKVIPYHEGAKVRCWTNVQGQGDRGEYNRYLLLGVDGLVSIKTRGEYDDA